MDTLGTATIVPDYSTCIRFSTCHCDITKTNDICLLWENLCIYWSILTKAKLYKVYKWVLDGAWIPPQCGWDPSAQCWASRHIGINVLGDVVAVSCKQWVLNTMGYCSSASPFLKSIRYDVTQCERNSIHTTRC